jgi:hypothetical protein
MRKPLVQLLNKIKILPLVLTIATPFNYKIIIYIIVLLIVLNISIMFVKLDNKELRIIR